MVASNIRKMKWFDLLVLLLCLAVSTLLFAQLRSSDPYGYDEADYMYAASKGVVSLSLDQPSVTIYDFVKTGLRSGLHSAHWRELSSYIRATEDITLYRHFHAPLYFYGLAIVQHLFGARESIVRCASFLSLTLMLAIAYWGWVLLDTTHGRLVGILAASLMLLSPTNVEGARWALPHCLYSGLALATLFLTAKLLQTDNLRYLYSALSLFALAALTLEYAPLLAVPLGFATYRHRQNLFGSLSNRQRARVGLNCLAIVAVPVLLIWPAGLLKLSLLKTYLFFAYISVLRNQAYGTNPLSQVWWHRFTSSPLEYLLLTASACYLLYLVYRRREYSYLQPFFLYAALMFLTTVRNHSEAAIHVSSLMSTLDVVSAFAIVHLLGEAKQRIRVPAFAALFIALAVSNFWFYFRLESKRPMNQDLAAAMALLRDGTLQGQRLLVPQDLVPTLHYYFPGSLLIGYNKAAQLNDIFRQAVDGHFSRLVYEGTKYGWLRGQLGEHWVLSVQTPVNYEPAKTISMFRLETQQFSARYADSSR